MKKMKYALSLRTLKRDGRIACSITWLLWAGAAAAQNFPADVQQIADMMVRLCLAGGRTQAVTGAVTVGTDVLLQSLDDKGNVTAEFKINKSGAQALVIGINNTLTNVAAEQADKLRDCLQPVRERLLELFLPPVKAPDAPAAKIIMTDPAPAPATLPRPTPPVTKLVPVRSYLRAADIPPPQIGAYGVVAFRSKPTSASRDRLLKVCAAFTAHLPPKESLPPSVPINGSDAHDLAA
jgi:hypothetical protein